MIITLSVLATLGLFLILLILRMKTQAIVIFAALVVIATLVSEGNCFTGPLPSGKRELKGKV